MKYVSPKILIIRLGSVGDVVRTLPALRLLRDKFPNAHITWLVEEMVMDLLENHPDLDEILLFPRRKIVKGLLNPLTLIPTIKEPFKFVKELRRKKFDLVLDFHGIFKSGLLSFLSGAPKRVGFTRGFSKELNYIFNNLLINPGNQRLNRIEKNLALLAGIGIDPVELEPIIPITDEDRKKIDIFFSQNQINNHKPLIAIHPGTSSTTPYKRWYEERYAALADILIEKYHFQIIFTWGLGELPMVERITSKMKNRAWISCKTENLRQLSEIFRRCNLYIGSDSGPMHLAALVRTPVIALFGPTDPIVNAPSSKNRNLIIRKDVSCSPCRKFNCSSKICMKAIDYNDVLGAVIKLLNLQEVS